LTLKEKLEQGHFVITAEVDPPRGTRIDRTLAEVEAVRAFVDAVNLSDAPMANLRMSPFVIARLVEEKTGVEAIPHLTARDRNTLALQAELLGASAVGVKNVLLLGGDPPERGDHPFAKPVYEVGAVELIRLAEELNRGRNWAGGELEGRTALFLGAAANPGAKDLALEAEKTHAKIEAGARFFQTQPVFSLNEVEGFLKALGRVPEGVFFLFGVLPLVSARMAERVGAWARVPEALVTELQNQGAAAGYAWARRTVEALRAAGTAGVHLFPLGRPGRVARVLYSASSSGEAHPGS